MLNDETVVELKPLIRKIVTLYFNSYTENTIMEYDTFLRFCRDFGIFPELCNKTMLHTLFYALAYANSSVVSGRDRELANPSYPTRKPKPMPSEAKKKVFNSGEYLNVSLFVDSLILCVVRSKAFEKETTLLGKILYFMEKILQTQGTAKVKKMVGKTR